MPYSTTINTFRFILALLGGITLVACGDLDEVALPINKAPTASSVSINDANGGDAVLGDSLIGNYIYADAEGDVEGESIYRWFRNGAVIGGATTSTYILIAADIGQSIIFEVTPVTAIANVTGSAVTSAAFTVNNLPTAVGVSFTGANGIPIQVGDNLTGNYTYADIDGDLEGISTFRWLRNGSAISGATTTTYILVADDGAASITFEVTPVALTGTATGNAVISSAIAVFNFPPIASNVTITDNNSGDAVLGDTLTGNYTYADVDGDLEGISPFRWLRNGAAIGGATTSSYILTVADIGQSITFEVTPVAVTGTIIGSTNTSSGITVINSAPTATGVSITDTNGDSAVVGDNLTGNYLYADWEGDLQGTSTLKWLRSGTPISGATAISYSLVAADSGQSISFEVTPVALTGTLKGSAVTSSGIPVANSVPTVSGVSIVDINGGNAVVGDSLTGNFTYADIDGDLEGISTFRWLRNSTAISGATNSTYTLVVTDSGTSISFEVTPIAATGIAVGSAVTSSNITVINSAPTVSGVNITDDNGGNAVVGDNLTGNYNYADVDGDLEGVSTFRWLRNGTSISGATASTYTLVIADGDQDITFEVTPVALTGITTGNAIISGVVSGTNSAPTASGVSITDDNGGSALVGDSLTGNYTYADIDGDLEGISTFQWLRNGTVISGATASTYTLVAADSGQSIIFEVTPVALTGTASVTAFPSSGITVANSAPTASGVSITDDNGGSAVVGDSLTGTYSYADVDGDAQGTSTFKWLRGVTPILGAINSTYTLVDADSGQPISFEVTPVAATGIAIGSPATSGGITVANSAPTASAVSITDDNGGSAVVGDSLTGSYTYADADNDAQGISTFIWLRDGTPILGAISSSYTLIATDSGTSITFEVTPVAATGTTTGSAVISGGITVANSAPTASGISITDDNGGSPVVGDSLTGSYSYADVDGDVEGTSTFRWLQNGAPITGATSSTYTLVAADSGQAITFEVTPVAATGTTTGSATTSTSIAVTNSAPTASVSITDDNGGSALVGDSLTGSYTYTDIDGDLEGISTFRWLRNGTAISGATASTYTLVAADSGQSISFEVTPVAATGIAAGSAATSGGIAIGNSVPTVNSVSISDDNGGNAVVGDNLTGSYVYADVDGDLEGISTFRWLRNSTPISGATAISYSLVAADSGQSIIFEVTPVALTGTLTGSAVTSSGITVINSAPTATGVSITDSNGGNAVIGDSLTGNYTYADADGDLEGISTFLWLRNGSAISGATAATYTLVAEDSAASITFEVTPVAATGATTGSAVISSAIAVLNFAPTASTVSITDDNGGDAVLGDTLTGNYTYADIDGDLEGISTFRWQRNGAAISGATALTYTTVAADIGQSITFEVTPIALTGTINGSAVTSSGVTVINSAPTATGVSITDTNGGSAVVGDSLTGGYTYADVDGDLEGTSTYRWLQNGAPISGATSSIYTLVAADNGTSITFEVTPVALTGTLTGIAVTSAGITVANSVPTASAVSINDDNGGSAVVGDSLTGSYTYADVDGDLEGTSTFRWLQNGATITGATSSTYTLVAADNGTSITFEVTPVALTGTLTGIAVTSAGITVANSVPTASVLSITDDNGGSAVVGDNLTGNYLYADADNDLEGTSTFRWLRNGAPITGALTSSYTLLTSDVPTQITFEVTPVAATGITSGSAVTSTAIATGTAPVISGFARYLDINKNGINDTNDQLIVPFDQGVSVNVVLSSDFNLPVTDDTFGVGATVAAGPASNEVTITLGSSPNFKTRQDFSSTVTIANSASGIDVAVLMMPEAIESVSGIDAVQSTPIDLIPAFVDSLQSLGTNISQSTVLGDVEGDGDLDMVVANQLQGNRVYTNDGLGNFTDSTQSLGANDSQSIALGDVDGDLDLDMVVANVGGGNRVYTNDGSGSFTDSTQSLGTNDSYSIVLGDVDGDGDLDMVVANQLQGNRVYTNDGLGNFTDSTQSLGANDSQSIALGDVDGDLDLDMVVANVGGGNRVYTNDGSGSFTDSTQSLGTNDSYSIVLGDVDGDLDLDMVVANQVQGNRVYTNDGLGSFSDSAQSLGTNDSQSIVFNDIDGDNDLDIVVANTGSEANRIWTNNGTGGFTDTNQSLGANNSRSVALGDVDGDGDLDMVITNLTQGNRVYLNSLSGT